MLSYFVAAAVVVWIAQTVLGLRQFKKFSNHIRDLRQEGRVAIGRARGSFLAGVIVLFIIDDNCKILKGEIMSGRTVFADFSPFEKFNGLTLFELSEELCKSMKLGKQETAAVVSARNDYESYKLMKSEENLATD
ncbi:MAG: transcriptional regulator GutM [Selenomonadaceae bacterium]|nr:transcriptional regulator GutM [Selenomonadaceae bacterium]